MYMFKHHCSDWVMFVFQSAGTPIPSSLKAMFALPSQSKAHSLFPKSTSRSVDPSNKHRSNGLHKSYNTALFLCFHCSSAVMEQGAKINCYYCSCSRNLWWKKKKNQLYNHSWRRGGKGDIEVFLHFRLFLSWRLSAAHNPGKGQNGAKHWEKWFILNSSHPTQAPSRKKGRYAALVCWHLQFICFRRK